MPKIKVDPVVKKNIIDAKKMIDELRKLDGNEAETRRRIERMFESLMGYDAFKHISREHAIKGSGITEHCDFVISIDETEKKPFVMVEIKRIGIDLATKHVRQASSYAIDIGCDWTLLTNGRQWQLYHVTFAKPPQSKLILEWDLLESETKETANAFNIISFKEVRRGSLDALWEKTNVLKPQNLLAAVISEKGIGLIRRELKKSTGVMISPEELLGGLRRLLNEKAISEFENLKYIFSKPKTTRKQRKDTTSIMIDASKDDETTRSEAIPEMPIHNEGQDIQTTSP